LTLKMRIPPALQENPLTQLVSNLAFILVLVI
jgi:hypothetical protein